jgi:uncharacterized protein with HEPN domain
LPFKEIRPHLIDIQESIENIKGFLREMDFEAYQADLKTKSAVERQMQIISEAASRLVDESESLAPRSTGKGYVEWATSLDTATTKSKTESYGTPRSLISRC